MTVFNEKSLHFVFPEDCEAIKFDDTHYYRNRFAGNNHKALDILAVQDNSHFWIEIKDCEGYEDFNEYRLSPNESKELELTRNWIKTQAPHLHKTIKVSRKKPFIVDEVIEKLRDTLVCLNFAKYENEPDLLPYANWFESKNPPTVILFLTWDIDDFKRIAKFLTQKLNTALQPYGLEGFVVNEYAKTGLNYSVSRIAT
jgi:hypothetical protein